MFPFDPPENIRKPLVFWCFQGDQKGTLGRIWITPSSYLYNFFIFVADTTWYFKSENNEQKTWTFHERDTKTEESFKMECWQWSASWKWGKEISLFNESYRFYVKVFPPKRTCKCFLEWQSNYKTIYEIFLTKWEILCNNNLHRFIVLVCLFPCSNSGYGDLWTIARNGKQKQSGKNTLITQVVGQFDNYDEKPCLIVLLWNNDYVMKTISPEFEVLKLRLKCWVAYHREFRMM